MPGLRTIPSSIGLTAFAFLFTLAGMLPMSLRAEPRFIFETGLPPWKGERLDLPPGFAPDLGWTGVEQIRFSPGMFQAGAPDFFSYVLVFLLEPGSDVSQTALERELLVYYRGLSKSVMEGKGMSVDTSGFTVSLVKGKQGPGALEFAPDATAWSGTLDWVEPFATQKAQKLHLELHLWRHGGSPVVFSCVSPVTPKTEAPWKELRRIRTKFRFAP